MPRRDLIQLRRGAAAEWVTSNPILANGEEGHETDTGKRKIGNGTQAWNDLSYLFEGGTSSVTSVNGETGVVVLDAPDIGLGNVDNTSDLNKPVSTATQTALNTKQNALVSGTSIKTIQGVEILGSGNIDLAGAFAGRDLSNLDSVQINTSLLPDTNNTHNLGESNKQWSKGYVQYITADDKGGVRLDTGQLLSTGSGIEVLNFYDDLGATAITQDVTDDSTRIATTAYVKAVVASSGGGGGTNSGQEEVDFGVTETDIATVTVSAAWVTPTSIINCTAAAISTTDHSPDEVVVERVLAYAANIVNGVSFDILASSASDSGTTQGKYLINYIGV